MNVNGWLINGRLNRGKNRTEEQKRNLETSIEPPFFVINTESDRLADSYRRFHPTSSTRLGWFSGLAVFYLYYFIFHGDEFVCTKEHDFNGYPQTTKTHCNAVVKAI